MSTLLVKGSRLHYPVLTRLLSNATSKRMPGVQYKLLTLDDVEETALFFKDHFFSREPIGARLGLTMEGPNWDWSLTYFRNIIKKGTSFKAVHIQNHGQIVAMHASRLMCRDEAPDPEEAKQFAKCTPVLRSIFGFLDGVKNSVDFCKLNQVDRYLMVEVAAVKQEYGGRGLVNELHCLAEAQGTATDDNCLSVTIATNIFIQKILYKNGYVVVCHANPVSPDGVKLEDLGVKLMMKRCSNKPDKYN